MGTIGRVVLRCDPPFEVHRNVAKPSFSCKRKGISLSVIVWRLSPESSMSGE